MPTIPIDPTDREDFETTPEALDRAQKSRLIRRARTSLGLSQQAFAERFAIPVGTLRDWEQARVTPPDFAVAYARVIRAEPEMVERVLTAI